MANVKGSIQEKGLEKALAKAPPMSFLSDAAKHSFENVCKINSDPAGKKLIQFAENWARLMEAEMTKGRELDQKLINECELLTDTVNATGFTYIWAKNLLIVHWKYGEKLVPEEMRAAYKEDGTSDFFTSDAEVRKYKYSPSEEMAVFT